MTTASTNATSTNGNATKSSNVLLEVQDLRTYFYTHRGVVKAVDGVTWDLKEGETLALVGESGSGKSVSALSVMRLIPNPPGKIVSGKILFQGQNLLEMSNDEIRHVRGNRIAMVFQEPMTSLNPVLTVNRQLTETLELHLKLGKSAARERAVKLLETVGIPDANRRLDDYPHQFSGGMRQRVMIAMALSCDPKLIIADEPTTALDVTIQAQVLEVIKGLSEKFNTSIMIITHNLGVVARHAHRVNVMYAGHIIETGPAMAVYGEPLHPYTLGLLQSVPRLDEPKKQRLVPIEGSPPDLMNLPKGCPFRPRCRFAVDQCAEEIPPLLQVRQNHYAACWVSAKNGGLPK
ncbi:MAG: ABC transporter ATP-binding protein [Chloroflexi bacterium]|nr:ABC transporter ATP-binding protein [Chloroflexota bacterium]